MHCVCVLPRVAPWLKLPESDPVSRADMASDLADIFYTIVSGIRQNPIGIHPSQRDIMCQHAGRVARVCVLKQSYNLHG